jgi:hypothetical protein
MSSPQEVAEDVLAASAWNDRVALIRRIPEEFGTALQAEVYARIAQLVYAPNLEASFAYVHWRDEYELSTLEPIYDTALRETSDFRQVTCDDLVRLFTSHPTTLRVFRLIVGLTRPEFAEVCKIVARSRGLPNVSKNTVDAMEVGGRPKGGAAVTCATAVDMLMRRELFPPRSSGSSVRPKIDKPDTADGWAESHARM